MYEFLDNLDFGSDVISLPENASTKAQAQKLMKRVLKAIRDDEEADYADIELSRKEVNGEDGTTVDGTIDMFISIYQNPSYKLEASVEVNQLEFGSDKLEEETFSYPSKEFDEFVCTMVDRYFNPLPKEDTKE
ncbi:hypothetical protein ERE_33010 [Agathobacter rectalis M104/1]|uniref:hypothetical protein n=1 Tax=Agathobacter rectalis TaxID=39491 RepID=UPI0001CD0AFC|nr:hypothetical protein [Agathobacter rectalis]CBK95052.1 hypothetical protein ERE_33010 [Agathobacter rectalis M104/1]